jgi:HAE1 family hydrophobic/amphiphilic exporter-1
MLELFIRRPVLSLVISLLIVLLGVLALFKLPVTQFPDIVPPSVIVTANYNGANASVCAKAVATPLERAINGVPGMTYMNSVSSNNGITLIEVFFEVGTDPDQAAVNVQNRVTTVLDELPEEVTRAGVTTEKEVNSMLLYLNMMSTDSTADEEFIYNFTDINILQELKRIDGVGRVEIMGARDYSMRVWLKPDKLLAYNISTTEIIDALRKQNIEAAPGVTGENSGKDRQAKQYVLKYTGKFSTPEEYKNVVLRADNDGSILHLKDVADVEFGTASYDMVSKTDGRPSASIMVKQRPGSNAQEVITNIKAKMKELEATTFPPGMTYNYAYDVSRFLDASIHEVLRTLVEAFILVFIVVFIFLQDFRSTLIPALAVPVALIGTLAFMQVLGFSINILTLFALVLAIGIVVDNAIVVVEAVHLKMNKHHLSAVDATIASMKEIGGAIIAITLVMAAVFVPVAFLSGPVGVFYRQFSLTLAMAIFISGVNALTLTPALCALLLKHEPAGKRKRSLLQKFFGGFNKGYEKTESGYRRLVGWMAGRRVVTVAMLAVFCFLSWGASRLLPSGFIPAEDQGMIYVNVTTPPGSTVERTEDVLHAIQQAIEKDENIENISTLAGYSLMSDVTGASYGMAMINLKSWEERTHTASELINLYRDKTALIADAAIDFFEPPTVPGFGNAGGFEFRLLNKNRNTDLAATAEVSENFLHALNTHPVIDGAFSSFDPNFPQYIIHVDQEMAAKQGVSIENAMTTLQTLLGSYYATNFIRFGQMYKVMLQALPEYRATPEDVLKLYVKNDEGEMVPFANFIRMERVLGPEQITRYNMYTAAMINGDAAEGYSSGEALNAIQEVADSVLPRGYTFEWSGMTREQVISGNQAAFIFLICLVFVYLLLAAQYESFVLPLTVILSLPAGIAGAFGLLLLMGLENNIYAQVALVMLIGLLGKNAILIIEFAVHRRKEGLSALAAAREAAASRLRPILMTSFAFIVGLIPLCVADGAGAMGNRSIGTAAAGGMLIGTIFGIFLVPGLFVLFSSRKKRIVVKAPKMSTVAVIGGAILLLGAGGCKVANLQQMPDVKPLPVSIGAAEHDTLQLEFKKLFPDTFLVALIDSTLANNTDIKIALQRIARAEAQLAARRGAMLPSVDGVVSGNAERYGDYTMDGVGNFDTNLSPNISKDQQIPLNPYTETFVGLRSNWEIDLWGKLKHLKNASVAQLMASREGRRLVITELVAHLSQQYYRLLALDAELKMLQKNIALQEEGLEIVKAQKAGGRATKLAVQQFAAQVMNTKAIRYQLLQERQQLENEINVLKGTYAGDIPRDTALPVQHAVFQDGISSSFLLRRPDVRQAELEMAAARENVRAARAAFLPSLVISPYIGLDAFTPGLLFKGGSGVYGLAGGLTAPVFHQRELRSRYKMVNAGNREAVYRYQQKLLYAYNEVATNMSAVENFQSALALRQQQVQQLREAVVTARDLYLSGYANYLEVIMAQRTVMEAELELIREKRDIFLAVVKLYRSLGGGWE